MKVINPQWIEVYEKIISAAYYSGKHVVELYSNHSTTCISVTNLYEAKKIFKLYNIKWHYEKLN